MGINEEDILANINELTVLALELLDRAENLRKASINLPTGEKRTAAIGQILEWTAEAEALNIRASELTLQMIENTKEPIMSKSIKNKLTGYMGSFLFVFISQSLQFLCLFGNESQGIIEVV